MLDLYNLLLLATALSTATSTRPSYRAAVYEHAVHQSILTHRVTREEALRHMNRNLEVYTEQVRIAAAEKVDIIVFPEDGITGPRFNRDTIKPYLEDIPDPTEIPWNPCNQSNPWPKTEVQTALSCMARNHSMYVVANMADVKQCDADDVCPNDGQYQYNTDVVFDPQGNLIARYHKRHLYFESQFDVPATAERVTFDTPFGKFGVFTCFDILFRDPAIELVEKLGVQNIVFPTAWMDSLPLLSAIQFHSSFAKLMKVNLLAANLHIPLFKFHGSGIYSPKRTESYYYNDHLFSRGKLVIADVKTNPMPVRRHQNVPDTYRHSNDDVINSDTEGLPESLLLSVLTDTENGVHGNELSAHDLSHGVNTDWIDNNLASPSHPRHHNHAHSGHHNHAHSRLVNQQMIAAGWATLLRDQDNYNYLPLTEVKAKVKVCQNAVCCYLDYQRSNMTNELYALGVFDGTHVVDDLSWYTQVCVLLKCESTNLASCGRPTKVASGYFDYIKLWGTFETNYTFPGVLVSHDGTVRLEHEHWKYQHNRIEFVNHGKERPLLTAALYGRIYERDRAVTST